ncbi:MAG: NTP transferase domain-containing protein [Actinobacteria bacterium]|nr:NTP transferase domain-containing protein [Actinomycetota bacterium]MBT3686815.1 NTP transferase domain-containing protein [Actinomycetota bacterium]MBT4037152.1 NTP transferase domain-containing protein [Actinomycetota bacterium]MBT4278180.1 NTP transferase domain-containing protein [Actinomycetota bacterium]MBT4343824.1 NTP transferase domain-containing protein [Actinomycetota bacterium]
MVVVSLWTVVVAAGDGLRFGSDKQSADLGGVSVLERSVATASDVSDGVVVVVGESRVEGARTLLAGVVGVVEVVSGGATRSASVRAGLAAVPGAVEVVLVHDGARPLATAAVYGRVIAAVRAGADAVVPVIAVSDSLRSTSGGVVDREAVVAVQTPQGFRAVAIRAAHAGGANATDDTTLVEANGGTVVVVDGETDNVKITRPVDLEVARCLLAEGLEDA